MSYLFDSSALFNLSNGGVLSHAIALPASDYLVCGAVHKETPTIRETLSILAKAGAIRYIDDKEISANQFLEIKNKYELGDGETECIVYAINNSCTLVSDDWYARQTAIQIIGQDRVTGSIGILQRCVSHSLLAEKEAYKAYLAMKAAGGYLPNMTISEMFGR